MKIGSPRLWSFLANLCRISSTVGGRLQVNVSLLSTQLSQFQYDGEKLRFRARQDEIAIRATLIWLNRLPTLPRWGTMPSKGRENWGRESSRFVTTYASVDDVCAPYINCQIQPPLKRRNAPLFFSPLPLAGYLDIIALSIDLTFFRLSNLTEDIEFQCVTTSRRSQGFPLKHDRQICLSEWLMKNNKSKPVLVDSTCKFRSAWDINRAWVPILLSPYHPFQFSGFGHQCRYRVNYG